MKSILNKTRQFSLILVIIISMMQPNSAYAASITVNSLADTVGDDGICTLREAIIAANTDTASGSTPGECAAGSGADTITFTTVGPITLTGTQLPSITDDLAITGAITINGGGTSRIFYISNGTVDMTDLIITNGDASLGGGIYNFQGSLILNNITISENVTSAYGGGIFNSSGTITLNNSSSISNNTAANDGGGVYNKGTLIVDASQINNNIATNDRGGGVYNADNATLTVRNSSSLNLNEAKNGAGIYNALGAILTLSGNSSTISSNTASSHGGGIYNDKGTLTLSDGTLDSNSSTLYGGGIYNSNSVAATLNNVVVSNNNSATYGGGIYNNSTSSSLLINSSNIDHNIASISGGGIFNSSGTITLNSSSTISNNTAANDGGGVHNKGTLIVDASQINSNIATNNRGGGVYNADNATLTVQNSSSLNLNEANDGAGIYNGSGATLTLSGGTLNTNKASHYGGGIYNNQGTMTLDGSTVDGNDALYGGGIYNSDSTATTLSNVAVSNNTTSDYGGGIFNKGTLTLNSSSIEQNQAQSGGGVFNSSGTITLNSSSTINNNTADIYGGGGYNKGTLIVDGSTVNGNDALYGGGIYDAAATQTTVTNSTLSNNSATSGGGVYGYNAPNLSLTNSTISANSATNGAGIYMYSGSMSLKQITVSNNSGTTSGGGLYNHNGTVNIENSILAGNNAGNNADCSGALASGGYNLVQDTTGCSGLAGTDITGQAANLLALTNNGGVTETHALQNSSPAINAANNASCEATDQRGETRPYGSICDMGAYEKQTLPEIDVEGNSISIINGDISPTTADHTDFGNVVLGNNFDRTFTIQNEGNDTLGLTGSPLIVTLTGSTDFSVQTQPANATIASSGSETFVIRCTPASAGIKTTTVSIANDDADENPYTFSLSCTSTAAPTVTTDAATLITVTGATLNGTINANNDSTTASFEYGLTIAYGTTVTAIESPVTGTTDTAITHILSGLTPNTTYHYRAVGQNSVGTINGADMTFTTGTTPEIDIQRIIGTSIPNNTTDLLGDQIVGIINLTYTIDNSLGSAPLNISSLTASSLVNSSNFNVVTPLPLNIAVNSTDTIEISFEIDAAGAFGLDLSFANNDTDESPYIITLSGTGLDAPTVLYNQNTIPANGAILLPGPVQIFVEFSEDMVHDGSATAANNIDNYLLVEAGVNRIFNTTSCAIPGGGNPATDDQKITINTATYDASNPYITTLGINDGIPIPEGSYRLFVCGTTSIENLSEIKLNNGLTDSTLDFTVRRTPANLPKTGFRQGSMTALPEQPTAKAYTETAMVLSIPKIGVEMPIVGVPQSESGWDVNWLGNSAGYLAGSAFPTWAGNTVITGHVWDAYNNPGIFAELKTLKYGDQVQIHAWGQTYTYEVRESNLVTTKNVSAILQSEEYDWVTLVTCEFYNPFTGDYLFRRAVRAVLISVK